MYETKYTLYSPELTLLSETAPANTATPPIAYDYIWFGGEPLAQVDHATGHVAWYFNDHLGTPIRQTDQTGRTIWMAEYEPYGTIYAIRRGETRHQPLRLPGQTAEAGSDLYQNVFRYYRADLGRYTQADPLEPGGAGILMDSELVTFASPLGGGTLRRYPPEQPPLRYSPPESPYTYAAGNPESFTDPFGLKVIRCVGGGTQIIPELIDPATGKPRRTKTGKLIGECKILLACVDPPKTIRVYTTTMYHVQPCPPCPGPEDCLAFVDTATGSVVGKIACKKQ